MKHIKKYESFSNLIKNSYIKFFPGNEVKGSITIDNKTIHDNQYVNIKGVGKVWIVGLYTNYIKARTINGKLLEIPTSGMKLEIISEDEFRYGPEKERLEYLLSYLKEQDVNYVLNDNQFKLLYKHPEILVTPHKQDILNGLITDNDYDIFNKCYCYVDNKDNPHFYVFIQFNNEIKKYQFIISTTTMTAFYENEDINGIKDLIDSGKKLPNMNGHIAIVQNFNTSDEAITHMKKYMKKELVFFDYDLLDYSTNNKN